MMQRHLHFGMDHKVKVTYSITQPYVENLKKNRSPTELNEKHTFMELMMNMQVTRPVTAVHMTVQECTNVFKVLEKFCTKQKRGICSMSQSNFEDRQASIKRLSVLLGEDCINLLEPEIAQHKQQVIHIYIHSI